MSSVQTRSSGGRVGLSGAVIAIGGLLLVMWVLEGIDQASGHALDPYGIRPQTDEGLVGIFLAPWLHGGWAHLISNSMPFLVLGTLVLLDGWRRWAWATSTIVVVSGLAIWLLSPPGSITLGASGIVFGWLTYLLVRGFYSGRLGQIAIGAAVLLVYGGILWGVLPGEVGVSWQGHLGGAVGGVLAARWLHGRSRGRSTPVAAHR
jgi:membrane associated rhomboid family serine protease